MQDVQQRPAAVAADDPAAVPGPEQRQQQGGGGRQQHQPYWDDLGPPSNPIDFPEPRWMRGRRANNVMCLDGAGRLEDMLENVLIRETGHGQPAARYAYWKDPDSIDKKTNTGRIEFHIVLERIRNDDDNDDVDGDDDEEIVFRRTDRRVVVKVSDFPFQGQTVENPSQEAAAMQLLGENPVHVLGAEEVLFDGQKLNVVMRFCKSDDLFALIYEGPGNPGRPEGECRYWFRQVMKGVAFLHSLGICHRDLSPENIMIDGADAYIIDMGLSLRVPYCVRVVAADSRGETTRCLFRPQGQCGKLPYMSKEIYNNRDPFDGAAADVWSSGTILFCMVTGTPSYGVPRSDDARFYWMTHGLRQLLTEWNIVVSDECIQLLEGMLQIDPRLRLTIDEVQNHAWFALPDEPPVLEEDPPQEMEH